MRGKRGQTVEELKSRREGEDIKVNTQVFQPISRPPSLIRQYACNSAVHAGLDDAFHASLFFYHSPRATSFIGQLSGLLRRLRILSNEKRVFD